MMNRKQQQTPPRIAASSYLNTAPLIWSFIQGSQRDQVELFTDTAPARCAEMLANGEVDVALVPVIEYQRLPEIAIVPDVCVGSRTAVRSVVLVTRKNNLKKVESVALDESSRTSATLVKIIFREFLGFDPKWETSAPDLKSMLAHADAALIIGDPAMKIPREKFRVHDLATLWHELTGFGFVFAMWMMRKDAGEKVRAVDFAAARDEGVANLNDVERTYVEQIGLSRNEIRSYLTENIVFKVDEEMEKGLKRYFELALKHALIESAKELAFVGD
ncbi:MAG TPA: menaquinone biosynthesis protein [Pyrinomonadaceae bacterium]|nr:menaquinone biosynthesis protein [Pyrinomonadaceae bacterium]